MPFKVMEISITPRQNFKFLKVTRIILYIMTISFDFQARIAFLQGERKGQENLKHDLVRRIKMLEYALKQERYALVHAVFMATRNVILLL